MNSGVSNIDADVDAKTVTVECTSVTDEQELLAALQKWGTAAGKTVELA
jgi:copper chaperone CopZ